MGKRTKNYFLKWTQSLKSTFYNMPDNKDKTAGRNNDPESNSGYTEDLDKETNGSESSPIENTYSTTCLNPDTLDFSLPPNTANDTS